MEPVLVLVVAVALAAPVFLFHYLFRLPEAPACPVCRTTTCDVVPPGCGSGPDRLLARLYSTQLRRCTSCGWKGRMRWRWALQRSRHEGGRR